MPDKSDIDLLREYAGSGSESAFEEIVRRHINLVYSVAFRLTGSSEDAQDVAQVVFVILARKAARLRPKTILTGWLYETTRFSAMNFLTHKSRRQGREQEAYMESTLNDAETENSWRQLEPLLEGAMAQLSEKDRTLVALRFFENKSFGETAVLAGLNEWTARKRVERSIEKLRMYFSKRGVASSTAIIAGALSANSVRAAPSSLAKSVSAVAAAKGATASTSTLALIRGTLKIMAWTKAKTAGVAGVAVLLAVATLTTLTQTKNHPQQEQIQVQNQTDGFLPMTSWSFKGYATPEDTFQSQFWAMSKGDVNAFLACGTPDFQKRFMENDQKEQRTTGKAASAGLAEAMAQVEAFQIVGKKIISDHELILHVRSSRLGYAEERMKKIDGEWKVAENLQPERKPTSAMLSK
jgi:RNA polymerase sigma factor (sigma-70 family)